MADFVAVLKKTLDGMGETTPASRQRVYDKARQTVAAKLAAISPPPPPSVADRQRRVAVRRDLPYERRRRRAEPRPEEERMGLGEDPLPLEGRAHRRLESLGPFASEDPDSKRVWWTDGGVHQNLVFPVQPDPISGMHCWHQRVTVSKAGPDDRYGDVEVDTLRSMAVFREWLALARTGPRPGNLRRPLWLARAVRPADEAYALPTSTVP